MSPFQSFPPLARKWWTRLKSPNPEPTVRILVGKVDDQGEAHTALIPLGHIPLFEGEGWMFVLADPDDLAHYLSWLKNRELEHP